MQAFLLTNTRLDPLHYGALMTMGADPLLKSPVTLRQPWRQLNSQPLTEELWQSLFEWLNQTAKKDDLLVVEGEDEQIERLLEEARRLGLIVMRPVWEPVPAFVPLISEDQ